MEFVQTAKRRKISWKTEEERNTHDFIGSTFETTHKGVLAFGTVRKYLPKLELFDVSFHPSDKREGRAIRAKRYTQAEVATFLRDPEVSSSSSIYRSKGNASFKAFGLCVTKKAKILKLKDALPNYVMALQHAEDERERASALKNMGAVKYNLMDLLEEDESLSCFFDALSYFSNALSAGRASEAFHPDWVANISKRMEEVKRLGAELLEAEHDLAVLSRILRRYSTRADARDTDRDLALTMLEERIGTVLFNDAHSQPVEGGDGGVHKRVLSTLRDADQFFRAALRRRQARGDEGKELQEFLHRSLTLQCTCESIQTRLEGDALFEKCLLSDEHLNAAMVDIVLDMYKVAAQLTKEKDVENEAVALSRLARLHKKVKKSTLKGGIYSKRAKLLADSLLPKDLSGCDWYKENKEILYECTKTEREQEETDGIKEKHEESFDKLEAFALAAEECEGAARQDKAKEMLTYLYKTFPPRDGSDLKSLGSLTDRASLRSAFSSVVKKYHPDKSCGSHGTEWDTIYAEVTKHVVSVFKLMGKK